MSDVDEIVVIDGWRTRLETIAGDRKRLVTWAAAVGCLLLVCLTVARARQPEPVIAAPATSSPEARATTAGDNLFVHVAGAVSKPGLYRFPDGTRVADAIEAAGGPLRRADLDAINLADLLTDGLKIDVPVRGDEMAVAPVASATPAVVDLNTADQAALETIPGVGPVTATAILQHRTEIGTYESVEQLLDVTGIGPATLEALRPYVSV